MSQLQHQSHNQQQFQDDAGTVEEEYTDSEHEQAFEEIVEEVKQLSCEHPGCGKIFDTQKKMKMHAFSHTNVRPFPCEYPGCDKEFKRRTHLNRHKWNHADVLPFQCPMHPCQKGFSTQQRLDKHIKYHDNKQQCSICKIKFVKKSKFEQHMLWHEKKLAPKIAEIFECVECAQMGNEHKFTTRAELAKHNQKHHQGGRKFPCLHPECGKTYTTISNLYVHQRVTHEGIRRFLCPCGAAFGYLHSLNVHRRRHQGEGLEVIKDSAAALPIPAQGCQQPPSQIPYGKNLHFEEELQHQQKHLHEEPKRERQSGRGEASSNAHSLLKRTASVKKQRDDGAHVFWPLSVPFSDQENSTNHANSQSLPPQHIAPVQQEQPVQPGAKTQKASRKRKQPLAEQYSSLKRSKKRDSVLCDSTMMINK